MSAVRRTKGPAASRFLGYARQLIGEDDIAAAIAVLRSDYLTRGPMVDRFEAALAERVGARHCVAVTSGTAALHLACLAAGLKTGDLGLTTPLTFVASANAMLHCGATPLLADIDPDGLGLAPAAVEAAIARHPEVRIVLPVHFAGLAHGSAALRQLAGPRLVIEDGCHALGATYEDRRPVGCGAYADMTAFSFHPVKPITTAEGGAVVTNDPELAHTLRLLRHHGIEHRADRLTRHDEAFEDSAPNPWYYEQQSLGFNYRMSDLQAALGLSQLGKLDKFTARRRAIAHFYDAAFAKLPHITIPQSSAADRARSAHHLYTIRVEFSALATTRKRFMERLAEHGVGSQVHYVPVHHHPFHRAGANIRPDAYPMTDRHYRGCLSLPLHPGLTDEEVDQVIRSVEEAVGEPC